MNNYTLVVKEIHDRSQINNLLIDFSSVFPRLSKNAVTLDNYAIKLSKYANVCIAKYGEETCGLLVYYDNDEVSKTAYISLIGLLPRFQGMGIGRKLLEYCVKETTTRGMIKIKLEVNITNIGAISFYKKHGFIECDERDATSMKMVRYLIK